MITKEDIKNEITSIPAEIRNLLNAKPSRRKLRQDLFKILPLQMYGFAIDLSYYCTLHNYTVLC